MKKILHHTLFQSQRLEDNLFEVWTEWHWKDGTYTVKDLTHHSSKREAEEQLTINKFKNLNK